MRCDAIQYKYLYANCINANAHQRCIECVASCYYITILHSIQDWRVHKLLRRLLILWIFKHVRSLFIAAIDEQHNMINIAQLEKSKLNNNNNVFFVQRTQRCVSITALVSVSAYPDTQWHSTTMRLSYEHHITDLCENYGRVNGTIIEYMRCCESMDLPVQCILLCYRICGEMIRRCCRHQQQHPPINENYNARQCQSLWYELVNLLQRCLSIFLFSQPTESIGWMVFGHNAYTAPVITGRNWCGSTNTQHNTTQNPAQQIHQKENHPHYT